MRMLSSTGTDNHGHAHPFLEDWQLLGTHLDHLESQEEPGILQLKFRNPNQDSSVLLDMDLQDFGDLISDEDSTVFARLVSQAILDELLRWPDGRSGQSRIRRGGRVDQ